MPADDIFCAAFLGTRLLAAGPLDVVARAAHAAHAAPAGEALLVFDNATGKVIDLDLRGSAADVVARLAPPPARGRPRLGVVAREVTLLPRHWAWLAAQPGGASAALRRLVEAASRAVDGKAAARAAQEAAYRFATAMAGDAPGYEAAMRALFAGDGAAFAAASAAWPADVRDHASRLAAPAFAAPAS
jgi:hypothetical protein